MNKDDLTTNAQSTLFALPDAKPLLVAGNIVVVNLLKKGSFVIRTSDHDIDVMNKFYKNGNVRLATKIEREYWSYAYVQNDLYGVNIIGIPHWLKWRETVART